MSQPPDRRAVKGRLQSPIRVLERNTSLAQSVEFPMSIRCLSNCFAKSSTTLSVRLLVIGGLGVLMASCAEIAPVPFTTIEGNWAPRGATCDETSLYFQFHEGLAQRLARYEPASELLFYYRDVRYNPPKDGQSLGAVSMAVNKNDATEASDSWESWSFTYHMNGRLSLASIDGSRIDKKTQAELDIRFSLEKCTIDQLHEIEGQEENKLDSGVTVPTSE